MVRISYDAGNTSVEVKVRRKIASESRRLGGAARIGPITLLVQIRIERLDPPAAAADTEMSKTGEEVAAAQATTAPDEDAPESAARGARGTWRTTYDSSTPGVASSEPLVRNANFGAHTRIGLANQDASNQMPSWPMAYTPDTEHSREVVIPAM